MNINSIRYFVETVSCKSINKASEKLYITQPALSLALRAFEDEVGVKLLNRSHQGVFPTEEGLKIYEDALKILELTDKWEVYKKSKKYIEVNLYIIPIIYNTIIHEIVIDIAESHPKFDIDLFETKNRDIISTIKRETKLSFGISYESEKNFNNFQNELQKEGIVVDFLFWDMFYVFINRKNSLSGKEFLTEEDLKELNLCSYINEREIDRKLKPLFSQRRFYRLSNEKSMLEMVKLNKAVTVFPGLFGETYFSERDDIKALPIRLNEMSDLQIAFYLCYKKSAVTNESEIIVSLLKNLCCSYTYGEDEVGMCTY